MAQFRCSVKPRLSRGKGASVARAVSYLAREKIEDERTGETFDFSHHKDRALWSGVYAPKDAPEWAKDLQSLVTEIERAEKRKDAQLALPIELSLAHELTPEQNRWMLQDFIKENFTRQGYATIAAIHEPPSHGDERNIHAHLLVTLRKLDEDGFSKTKHEQQENFLTRSERVEALRQSWEKHLKHHLERHGFEKEAEAISCKSLEAQGIDREPTQHLGPVAAHIERAGDQSERGDLNRDIEERNKERERLKGADQSLGRDLAKAYERGADMVSQQQAAMRHHEQRQKDLEEAEAFKQREAEEAKRREDEALKRLEAKAQKDREAAQKEREETAKRQREHEARQREEQRQREQGGGFAGRKDHGQQQREERGARMEMTEAQRREQQKNIMKELFERRFGKGHNEKTLDDWGERERER